MRKIQLISMVVLLVGFAQVWAGGAPGKVIGATTTNSWLAYSLASQDSFTFVDLRSLEEYNEGHVPGAKHLDYNDLTEQSLAAIVDKKSRVVLYCSGVNSELAGWASQKALDWGWQNGYVFYYRTGINEWVQSGLSVEK
ncbi:MAG: rhodanese-like domain-containing protein [Methylococcales bacterium]|jgi:rhodanese-related sulfurtransferase|nr:rhodanese-like domain-containing protein [Methylococcales bacterium]